MGVANAEAASTRCCIDEIARHEEMDPLVNKVNTTL